MNKLTKTWGDSISIVIVGGFEVDWSKHSLHCLQTKYPQKYKLYI